MTTPLLAFGDSITVGASASNIPTTSYVARVATALGLTVENHAIAGATMLGSTLSGTGAELVFGVVRASILQQMMNVPSPVEPTRVVMIVGTVDMGGYGTDPSRLASFGAGLRAGLVHLAWAGGAQIWVGTTPKESPFVANASEAARQAYVAAIASAVAQVRARGFAVHLVPVGDIYDPLAMSDEADGHVHPNDIGHAALGGAFLAAMGLS